MVQPALHDDAASTLLPRAETRRLVDRLRAFGLDKHVDLPQIAVMGDTSSGKSSVLSALSGIAFPSAGELTTRCPTQLILSHAHTLHGTVRLRRFQSTAAPATVTTITTLDQVTSAIEALTTQLLAEGQSISDDAIEITLQGPSFPDLTLTDLPGLVRTVRDGEDPRMIPRVRQLVKRYLAQERTIILAVVPANVSMHNSEILQAAAEADPTGARTLSIITKPDLVDVGAEAGVVELLLNKTKQRRLGYHMVKCRGQHALNTGVSIADARRDEAAYFASHDVWRTIDRSLLGTQNLALKLSALLTDTIEAALPAVAAELDSQIRDCKHRLAELGAPLDTPEARRRSFSNVARTVTSRLGMALDGSYNDLSFFDNDEVGADNRLRAQLRAFESEFSSAVADHATVTTSMADDAARSVAVGDYVHVRAADGSWTLDQVTRLHERPNEVLTTSQPTHWLTYSLDWRHLPRLNLDAIKTLMVANRGDELPLFLSYTTFANIVRQQYVRQWHAPMHSLYGSYARSLKVLLGRAIASSTSVGALQRHLTSVATDLMTSLGRAMEETLDEALAMEARPYTMNTDVAAGFHRQRSMPLLSALDALADESDDGRVSIGAVKAVVQLHCMTHESLDDLQARDLLWALQAYLHVAAKRFSDKIPMLLQARFLVPFMTELRHQLATTEATDAILERLLRDGNATARTELAAKLRALEQAKAEIHAVV
ncbi:hypothetical protein SDRG_14071 [Saprolegnia diclina VS20]|uniref:Dynamin-type G domain-containing protein n=1 Tax=Saprolegnia diclina (strain VS20) TaxID=1156394 RepID=T0R839_SAPDV|nr:hypothetical protein SDRG_14071 [Saprolegnia diclina VS20]EQC28248.1 hypothetical protein SDRG_14071 [Saprolegnia diclina VS20]|eukprot:XP_008618397.1 hypothetical protein SDRG_14071 [Saprolegnia diclina VS20]